MKAIGAVFQSNVCFFLTRNSRYNPAFDCPHCDFRAFEISKRERHAIEVHNEYKLCTDVSFRLFQK